MNFDLGDATKIVTEDEIRKSGGIIYDPTKNIDETDESTLPDVNELLNTVNDILEMMCTDEMIALKETDAGEYNYQLETKFPEFTSKYFSLFQQITSGADLTYMFKMFASMDKVNKGESTLDDVEKQLGVDMQTDFVVKNEENVDLDSDDELFDETIDKKKKKKKKNKKKK